MISTPSAKMAGRWSAVERLRSAGIDQAHRDHAQRGDAGQEEVFSAAQLDKIGQVAANEWWIRRGGIALHHELALSAVVSHERVFVVPLVRVVAVLDPLLLNEFELAGKTGLCRHENYDALLARRCRIL